MTNTLTKATAATLNAAYAARSQARAKKQRTAEALERAQRLQKKRQAGLTELETASSRQIDERGRELAKALSEPGPTAVHLPAPAAVEDGASALTSAKIQAAIADSALTLVQDEDRKAQADLQAAEANVIACVDAIFADEKLAQERELTHHLDEAVRIGSALLFTAMADEMDGRRTQPPQVTAVLARLDQALVDRRNVATNFLRFGDTDAAARRAARRVAMIAAEEIKEVEAA